MKSMDVIDPSAGFRMSVFSFGVFLASCSCAAATSVTVSDFGYDAADSTEIVQKALDSGARRIVFDRKSGPWIVRPLFVRSDSELVFEEGVEIVAKRGEFMSLHDALISLSGVTNVVLRGQGKGATLRMWGDDYRKPPYARAEWRHTLNILSSHRVTVENLTFRDSGGDGIYLGGLYHRGPLGPNVDVVIRDCVCDSNHRQGISVITARNLLVERTVMKNTRGAAPQSGIDFEPNYWQQEFVNCVLRDCTIVDNANVGCWLNLSHFTDKTKPVSVTIEKCRFGGNHGSAFMLCFKPSQPEDKLPRGGFVHVKDCVLGGNGPAAFFSAKRRGSVDVVFENCTFDGCQAHLNQPDVTFLVQDRMSGYEDGITFKNVTIRQGRAREWLGMANRPWIVPPKALSGDVTIVSPEGVRKETLDGNWIRRRFSALPDFRFDFTHTGFDPALARPVDHAPGRSVGLSPIKFRGTFQAWVYADGPREVTVRAVQQKIGSRRPMTGVIPVMSADGGKVAEVPAPGTSPADLRFKVPAAGFYRMTFDTKGNAVVFRASDVPLGIVPSRSNAREQYQLDVYRSTGRIYFRHAARTPSILFVGGGGSEYVSVKVTDPFGATLLEDKALGQWGFVKLDGAPSGRLYRIDVDRPVGLTWEDSYVDLRGEPSVFFLTSEKYW